MPKPFLPPDDLPSAETVQSDRQLYRDLADSVSKHFYEACDGVTQALLLSCKWCITLQTDALLLAIDCPNMVTNWRVLNNILALGNVLEKFVKTAKIRVCPPAGMGTPFEIRVDEISIYRDLF